MSDTRQKTRKRYSPEVRRTMILDQTAKMVASEGISKLSMERIGQESGVSKALIYNYFDNVTELLRELLERELKALRKLQFEAAEQAETFEELVRNITHQYLNYINERGMIIERLQSEPNLSEHTDPTGFSRRASVDYLGDIFAKHFDMPIDVAKAATDISFGLPAAAGAYLLRSDMELKEIEDLTVSMIMGSMVAARDGYMASGQKLKR